MNWTLTNFVIEITGGLVGGLAVGVFRHGIIRQRTAAGRGE